MRTCLPIGVVAALAIGLASGVACAQTLALDRFEPAPAGDRMFGVQSPTAIGHLSPYAMLLADYAHNPFVLREVPSETTTSAIVANQLVLHVNGGVSLWNRLLVNVDVPMAAFQSGENSASATGPPSPPIAPGGADFGDIRVGLRYRLWGNPWDAFQIALSGYLFLPTGHKQGGTAATSYVTDGNIRGSLALVLGGTLYNRFVWAANLAPEYQQDQTLTYGESLKQGSMFLWGAGVGVLLLENRQLQLGTELGGAFTFADIDTHTTNLELLAHARYGISRELEVGAGAGPGLAGGIGTPDVRAVVSMSYAPQSKGTADRDHDGIPDSADACPDVPGDADADPKKNGCPKTDRDGDGILDAEDACPDVKGVRTGDPLTNGCPRRADSDGDGVPDSEDACPDVKGVRTDNPLTNGCPPDRDGDGIADAEDACPDEKGVRTAVPTTNGCPPDTDGDGIPDATDACPNEKGEADSDPTKNGCPLAVRVSDKEIIILEQVQFETGKAVIKPASDHLLTEVAGVLNEHTDIVRLEVQGHTDNRGTKALNQKLSQARADAVMAALVKRGVNKARLSAKGYGQDRPIVPNITEGNRQKNRRVQFRILEKASQAPKK